MGWVLQGMKKFQSIGESATVQIKNHDALNKLRLGQGAKPDLDILVSAFNVMEGLLSLGYGLEYVFEIRAAQDALHAVATRGVNKGKFIMTGPEMVAINTGMEIHDAQLDACTVKDIEQALEIVNDCVRNKRARRIVKEGATSVKSN
jgi:hypothetical protein